MATTTKSNTLTVIPSGYDTSNTSSGTISSISNAYTNTSSTTYATIVTNTTTNGTSYISFTFDLSSIPSNATIGAVSCNVKASLNQTSSNRTSSFVAQLYSGTTAMGSSYSIGRVSTATTAALTCGTWTRTQLDSLKLRFTHTRGSSSNAVSMYIYGAELSISYTYQEVTYTVTITSTGDGITNPTGEQTVSQGDTLEIMCVPNEKDCIVTVTDNGTDVSSQLVNITDGTSGTETGDSGTVSAVISSYDTVSGVTGTYYQSAVGNGSDTSTTTTGNNYTTSSGSTVTIYYNFDLSSVPEGSTITSVTCSVKGHLESTSSTSESALCQLYKGSTAVGTGVSFTSTTDAVITITDTGDWTYDDLSNLKLGFTIGYYGGNVTGATVTVSYVDLGDSGTGYLYNLTSIADDHTIDVIYGSLTKYTITTTISGGTMTSDNPVSVIEGKDSTLTFTKSNTSYVLKSMKVDGVSVTPTLVSGQESSTSWTGTDTVTITPTTNTDEYTTDSNGIAAVCDGDSSTYYWTQQTQAAGDYILLTLGESVYLKSVSSVCTKSTTDYFKSNCSLQISTDGSSWTTIGTCADSSSQSFTSINQVCKYVRFYINSASNSWWCVNEITLDYNTQVTTESISEHYEYTISNVTGDKTVSIIFGPDGPVVYVKTSASTWKMGVKVYKKTSSGWTEMTTDEFNTLVSGKKFIKKETPEQPESAIGNVTSSTNAINITDDTIDNDTYTLYYEDADNNKLTGWDSIGTITKS